MSDQFLGEIRPFGFNFAPLGWAMCNGQSMSIQQSPALFSLLGTFYGGNGTSTFALPDLRSRVPIGMGQGTGLPLYDIGESGGVESVTLIAQTMPTHAHTLSAANAVGNHAQPAAGAAPGSSKGEAFFATGAPSTSLNPGSLSPYTGGNQPHENRQPYLAINWCIALQGVFPPRS